MAKKKVVTGTGLDDDTSYVLAKEQDMSGINNDNQQILAKLGEIQNSLISINARIDGIDKKEKEHWFFKNLKSPNFFAVWIPAVSLFIWGIAKYGVVEFFKKLFA